ncbi:putative hydrolase of the HAD superfamily [Actinopolymorpha pittospori]|uniref:Hydrolase of the HAD superfamily n=2 Tax=Actinopolymorpha pittospori TaxID=648752 RepID=A0A927MX20_9ACTN|nr:HAD-IA family hydrolase [Actinopolymorpha pittospori]MBE1608496.1 putative hydrolase of the HAD superfamily [Actinopolymorpha pittospori]
MTGDEFSAALGAADPDNGISTGRLSLDDWRDRCAEALGLSSEQADSFVADMWDWYCGELDEELMAYVANLPQRYRTAIISNSGSGAREVEETRYGFSTYFDPIIYSHEVGLLKPDPRIYAIACDRLRLEPHETVFLDDSQVCVDGARAFGMHGILHESTATSIRTIDTLLADSS